MMRDGWVEVELGVIAEFIDYRGKTPKKTSSGIPLITAKNVRMGYIQENPKEFISKNEYESWMTRGIPKKGDVLITTEAPLGLVAQIKHNEKIALAQRLITFQVKHEVVSSFLKYNLMSPQFQSILHAKATGTTVKGIKASKLKKINVFIAPIPEQRAIVAKIEQLFSDLDNGIANLKSAKEKLETYRQAVLKKAFEGELTKEWRAKNRDLISSNDVQEKKDGLPNGWKRVKLGKVSNDIVYGYTKSSSKDKVGPKFLRITDIQNNKVKWDQVPYCRIEKDKLPKYLLKDGDLVFARTGATVGKSFLIKGNIPKSVFASYLIRVRLNKDIISEEYVEYFFHSIQYWQQITKGKVGIGQPNVNSTKLKNLLLPLPNLYEQKQIVQTIETRLSVCDKLAESIEQSLEKAKALRQSILKKVFSGQFLSETELEACRREPDWESADKLLERIKNEKKQSSKRKKKA